MPPERTPARHTGRPTGPLKSAFDPSLEGLTGVAPSDASRINRDPYRNYVLKTGKHWGLTVKRIAEIDSGIGYLRWMVTNPKARKGIDDDHIIRRALKQWNDQAGGDATVWPSEDESPAAGSNDNSTSVNDPRFKDSIGQPMWITGADIIGLFHMKLHQLQRY